MIHLVFLSGGSGTRLWPLSNNARSKQFLKVLRNEQGQCESMVQRVFRQVNHVDAAIDITIAAGIAQEESIRSQITGKYNLVIEPERRDTAPAIMLACAHLKDRQQAADDDTVIVMPIDTFAEQTYYDSIIELDKAVQSQTADLILLGVEPTYASTKYGYIVPEKTASYPKPVTSFKEKPEKAVAKSLIDQDALWNCGVFAFKLGYLNKVTSAYIEPGSYERLFNAYDSLPKNSFDFEIVENASSVAVVPYHGTWKDLGTWNSLTEEMTDVAAGRVIVDNSTCANVHVINETELPMVVAGLQDAVVIATPDGILACDKEVSAYIKPFVNEIAETRPMHEQRRWGEYRVIDSSVFPNGTRSLSKVLIISAGKQLSYQRHAHRHEVWTIVSGSGEVVLDGEIQPVSCGSVINIQPLQMHAARSFDDLHIIEVQLGDQLAEEDIERFGNFW